MVRKEPFLHRDRNGVWGVLTPKIFSRVKVVVTIYVAEGGLSYGDQDFMYLIFRRLNPAV